MLYDNLGMHANTLRNYSCCPPRFLCTLNVVRPPQIHMVRPVLPCCLLPWNPYFSLPWDTCSPSANAVSFLSSTSLLLLASHQRSDLGISLKVPSLGISPRVSWSWHLTKDPLLGLSPSDFLSCSLLFSQQECLNYPRMGAPSCPSRPHEGRWGVF